MTRKLTQDEWISKARAKHGDRYDYSKVVYVDSKTKLTIICLEHGDFEKLPSKHLGGQGCRLCAKENSGRKRRKTTAQFIADAKKVHGDKYDYSKVNYNTAKDLITIICSEHGEFEKSPNKHLGGQGCQLCAKENMLLEIRKTTAQFISDAQKIHSDKYDYSKVNYTNSNTDVIITCSIHGDFEQRASHHLMGSGCRLCAKENSGRKRRKTTDQFIAEAKEIHGDKYDYSKVNYTNCHINVIIICLEHGDFEKSPSHHLSGQGCQLCAKDRVRKTQEQFIAEAKEIHGDKYDYSKVNYINNITNVTIICSIHGDFEQRPSTHISGGSGCLQCATTGFNPKGNAFYYVHEILNELGDCLYYKAGISGDWQNRLKILQRGLPDHLTMKNLDYLEFEIGQDAYDLEQRILKQAEEEGWKAPVRDFDGGTELFLENPIDFLNLRSENES